MSMRSGGGGERGISGTGGVLETTFAATGAAEAGAAKGGDTGVRTGKGKGARACAS